MWTVCACGFSCLSLSGHLNTLLHLEVPRGRKIQKAMNMEVDPNNYTRWKHKFGVVQDSFGVVRKRGLEHQKKKVPDGRGQERFRDFFDVTCKTLGDT